MNDHQFLKTDKQQLIQVEPLFYFTKIYLAFMYWR